MRLLDQTINLERIDPYTGELKYEDRKLREVMREHRRYKPGQILDALCKVALVQEVEIIHLRATVFQYKDAINALQDKVFPESSNPPPSYL